MKVDRKDPEQEIAAAVAPSQGVKRRSFLKTCGSCSGALALGLGATPGVASATNHIVYFGQNKRFDRFNYSFEDRRLIR
uniref:twin-arginine translocation signal domain-containing protein n=1 Tax=Halalkalicoccus ordinarius TaxID=3116651 RepID=UPI003907F85A